MLKHGILGLINYHEMTGYEIMQAFRDSLNYFWKAQTSQIYRELQNLEQKNWVAKTIVPQQGKPDKNIYSITEEGRHELIRWLSDGDPGLVSRNPFLMKVFFMGEQSREENLRCFRELKACCQLLMEGLDSVPEQIKAYGSRLDCGEKSLSWEMTVEYGRRNMKMLLEWAQDCMAMLEGNRSR